MEKNGWVNFLIWMYPNTYNVHVQDQNERRDDVDYKKSMGVCVCVNVDNLRVKGNFGNQPVDFLNFVFFFLHFAGSFDLKNGLIFLFIFVFYLVQSNAQL